MKAKGRFTIAGRISRSRHPERIGRWVVVNQKDRPVSYHATWQEAERARRAMNKRKGAKAA